MRLCRGIAKPDFRHTVAHRLAPGRTEKQLAGSPQDYHWIFLASGRSFVLC
jgi:hypothetical protein